MTPTGCAPELRRRLVATAGHSLAAGDLFRARALLEEVIAASPPGPARAAALRLLGEVRFQGDSCAEATRHLDQALAEAGDGDRLGALIGLDLAFTLVGLADIAAARHHAHTAVGHAERMDDPGLLAQALGVAVMVDFLSGHGVDEARLERALALEVPDDAMVVLVRPSLIAALIWTWIGQLGRSRPAFERLWRLLVDRGEEAGLPNLSLFAAFTECLAGDLRRAGRYADDGLEAAGLVGGSVPLGMALSAQSLVHAYAGQPDAARDEAKEAVALLAGSGWRTSQAWPLGALGFLEVSLGNAAAAERALAPVTEMMSASGCSDPATSAFVPDEVEALVALGELDRAEVLLDRFDGQARAHDRAWALATSARCRGLLQVARGDLNAAMRSLEQALVEHKRVLLPLERGRTLLVMGQVQRRRKEKRAAKASLASALATFEGIGAAIWVGRAQAELARVGLRPRAPLDLTATEARVAELAASGLTTRQVAAQVFLTPKSVEGVLARIYRKLGVTSRAGLANRLSRADATS
jgi:DNA-binding CsgD family transcriptional regulator